MKKKENEIRYCEYVKLFEVGLKYRVVYNVVLFLLQSYKEKKK